MPPKKKDSSVWSQLHKKRGRDDSGREKLLPTSTADNFLQILRLDDHFSDVRFNVMRACPVVVRNGGFRLWTDADDAEARTFIERTYGISSRPKYEDAFRVFLSERSYHPVQERLHSLEWDSKPRCEEFFIRWMGAEDTPYTREVSRLFFAAGICRAEDPGCKVDSVLVLIGGQGGGKSSICRWLAMDDAFYSSTKTISGQRGYEAIQGKWIVEIEELLAVLANDKAGKKVEESAKAFLSSQSDFYRKPYDRRSLDNPRHCVFIGTTNRHEFLTDKTGNRRWFPLFCKSDGGYLYQHAEECKSDIMQAWAEMLTAYQARSPFCDPVPKRDLLSEITDHQRSAEVDDYRIGLIADFIDGRDRTCVIELWNEAIHPGNANRIAPTRSESCEIAEILVNHFGWVRGKSAERFPGYGPQKVFRNPKVNESQPEIPF